MLTTGTDNIMKLMNIETVPQIISRSVVLGHPDLLISEGVASILRNAGFKVLGIATTEEELTRLAARQRSQLILFDTAISRSPVDFVRDLRLYVPGSIIVILAKATSGDSYIPAIEAGASGCISVDISSQELVRSLETLLEGNVVISRKMVTGIRKELSSEGKPRPIEMLSDREREVLSLVGLGSTNRQIARKLFLSEHTIKIHVRSILNKLDLQNRQQAAVFATREGLVKDAGDGEETPDAH